MSDSVQFIIELTSSCNFSCKYCYLRQASSISDDCSNIMNSDTGRKSMEFLIKKIYKKGIRIFVDFLDGEPLLNFQVMKEMIEMGKRFEEELGEEIFIFRFTTNGSVLTQEIVEFTIKNGVYFNVSIDGAPKTHDINRVYHNGCGTSKDVHSKVNLLRGLENAGVVSTYSPETCEQIVEGTNYLIDRGIRHIELNYCMGKIDYYNEEDMLSNFRNAIDIYLKKYAKGDFQNRYVILDEVLRGLYSRKSEITYCMKPYKISCDGSIMSCDRIPKEMNKKIASVFENEISIEDMDSHHLCGSNECGKCRKCDYRYLCTPCNIYMNETFSNINRTNPVFCQVMQTIIERAMEFYEKNKNNIIIALEFDSDLREKIKAGDYMVKNV